MLLMDAKTSFLEANRKSPVIKPYREEDDPLLQDTDRPEVVSAEEGLKGTSQREASQEVLRPLQLGGQGHEDRETRAMLEQIRSLEQANSMLLTQALNRSATRPLDHEMKLLMEQIRAQETENACLLHQLISSECSANTLAEKLLALEKANAALMQHAVTGWGDQRRQDIETRMLMEQIKALEVGNGMLLEELLQEGQQECLSEDQLQMAWIREFEDWNAALLHQVAFTQSSPDQMDMFGYPAPMHAAQNAAGVPLPRTASGLAMGARVQESAKVHQLWAQQHGGSTQHMWAQQHGPGARAFADMGQHRPAAWAPAMMPPAMHQVECSSREGQLAAQPHSHNRHHRIHHHRHHQHQHQHQHQHRSLSHLHHQHWHQQRQHQHHQNYFAAVPVTAWGTLRMPRQAVLPGYAPHPGM